MFAGKPVIGIVGGIGSGKSLVAGSFGQFGCLVIDSDQLVRLVYQLPKVRQELRCWWGDGVFGEDGEVIHREIAQRIFGDSIQRRRLEGLIFPLIDTMRQEAMQRVAGDKRVVGYVWDAPLLIEAGLAGKCDAVVFVDTPGDQRLARVEKGRGWSRQEWERREKLQLPLDKKREVAKYTIRNTAGTDDVRNQVRQVLSCILAGITNSAPNTRLRTDVVSGEFPC